MTANTSSTSTGLETATRKSRLELQELVRRRAYELYEQRGKEDGHDLEDWLQAQSEVIPQGGVHWFHIS